jgi:RND family efflux transporter MFP subunit
MRIIVHVVLALVVVAGGVGIMQRLIATKPEPRRQETPLTAALVTVVEMQPRDEQIVVPAMGTVGPAQSVVLQPQVTGQILEQSPELRRGGRFRHGDVIARIDPRDYELAVDQAMAAVERAQFELRVEEGRQTIARREWDLLQDKIQPSETDRELALRQPHLRNARAAADAAESALAQAKLALDRTVIRAPFNCMVLRSFVDPGQLVSPQGQIAEIVGTDEAWVEVAVPVERLSMIRVPAGDGDVGSPATVIYSVGPQDRVERPGHVLCICGDVEPAGRLARLLVAVPDPFGLADGTAGAPLLMGAYVKTEIQGPTLEGVFVVPRVALREGDQVWVMDRSDRLDVRDVTIAWRRESDVLVSEGLAPGDRVVTSMIPTPIPGMELRTDERGLGPQPSAPDVAAPAPNAEGRP